MRCVEALARILVRLPMDHACSHTHTCSVRRYFPVTYAEPLRDHMCSVGFDLGSDRLHRDALLRMMRTGECTATDPLTLVQDNQYGRADCLCGCIWSDLLPISAFFPCFLFFRNPVVSYLVHCLLVVVCAGLVMFAPVFNRTEGLTANITEPMDMNVHDAAWRWRNLVGSISAVFHVSELLQTVLSARTKLLSADIFAEVCCRWGHIVCLLSSVVRRLGCTVSTRRSPNAGTVASKLCADFVGLVPAHSPLRPATALGARRRTRRTERQL